ncbi:universal stress protein [Micromonosporaceae bacterium Da 78-11]
MTTSGVVVGVNGSTTSIAALRWAAVEAQLRGADLHVVVAHRWRIPGKSFTSRSDLLRTTSERVKAILGAAVRQARTAAPEVRVRGVAVVGDPVPVLLEAAANADLLVVGGRGHGTPEPLLGTVTGQVAAYAPCSVAVVRDGWSADRNTIVVGIDDSPTVSATVGTAFEEAALRRSATLLSVTAYTAPLPGSDLGVAEAGLYRRLGDELAPWRDKYPQIPVACEVVNGSPGTVLVEDSQRAGLLVVGAGSRQDFDGLRLGPVRLHLLHHAGCPVLIARTTNG